MIRCRTVLVAVAWVVTACGGPGAEQSSAANGAQSPAARAPTGGGNASAANASTSAHPEKYAPGAKLRLLRDAKCEEFGPDAFPEPWDISKGALVIWVAEDGSNTIVEHAPGMQCRLPSDAVGPY